MDGIGQWCKLISCFSVISSLFVLLVPEKGLKRAFNTLLTVILVFILILPLKGVSKDSLTDFDAFFDSIKASDVITTENLREKMLLQTVESETESYLDEAMLSMNISCTCQVICEYTDNEIIITAVEVYGEITPDEKVRIEGKIQEISEQEIDVYFKGELYE